MFDEGATAELLTLRDWLRFAVSRFNEAGLWFGHGSADAYDEAAYLLLHTLHLPLGRLEPFLDARLSADERNAVAMVLRRRVQERIPAAYLTHEAWLGEYRFYVDERVIVPRSYIAELLEEALTPWIGHAEDVSRALDLCTGSGCLAIILAHAFPAARIDAADVSDGALAVAARNVADYGLAERIDLIRSDLFDALAGRSYDLIVCNPPYVTVPAMRDLPAEYRHEPALALAGGEDGLDCVRRILRQARRHLTPSGILLVEIGHNRCEVENAFPRLPFTWLSTRSSEGTVFLLHADALPDATGEEKRGTA